MIILSYAILKQSMYLYIILIVLHNGLGKISNLKFFYPRNLACRVCNNAGTLELRDGGGGGGAQRSAALLPRIEVLYSKVSF